jgi:4-azaleucine resistance transporter AzlC
MNVTKVFRLTLPVASAYGTLGVAFGVYLTTADIAWYWAPVSAFMIFAGSIEFLAVSFMLSGYPLYLIAFSAFIINFRHIFYGLSFPYSRLKHAAQKAYGIWALTDETYGITTAGEGKRLIGSEITLLQIISHCWWVGGALVGALLGLIIPSEITGFEFSLTTMFVILSIDAFRESREIRLIKFVIISALLGVFVDKYIMQNSFLTVSLLSYFSCLTICYWRSKNAK